MKNKLTYNKRYGRYCYAVNKEDIENLTEVKVKNNTYKVVSKLVNEPYFEMGHRYDVASKRYYIIHKIEGIKVEIDLLQFLHKTTVTATKFAFFE